MSVPDQVPKTEQVVSGGNVTQFSYDFYAPDTANVYVLVNSSAVSSGWSVSSNAGGSGYVEFAEPVISGATVTIYRSTPMEQTVSLGQGDSFYPQVITECMDNVVMCMQEVRSGSVNIPGEGAASAVYAQSAGSANQAGYASVADYASSAGLALDLDPSVVATSAAHATTAAGLDSGVIVQSAVNATNAGSATYAGGAEFANSAAYAFSAGFAVASGGTATYASNAGYATNAGGANTAGYANSAGYADVAGALVSGATVGYAESAGMADVASSAYYADSAGNGGYDGPFAVHLNTESDTVGCNSGYVFAGGTRYLISGFEDDTTSVGMWGGTVYLTLLSSGGSITSGLTDDPSGLPSDTVIVRLAERSEDEINQIQYGDITTVPWGISAGGIGGAGDNAHDQKAYVSIQGATTSFQTISAEPNTIYYVAFHQDLHYDSASANYIYNYYMPYALGGGSAYRAHTNFSDLTDYFDSDTHPQGYGIEFALPSPTSACSIEFQLMPDSNVAFSTPNDVSVITNTFSVLQHLFIGGEDQRYVFNFVPSVKTWYLTILV